ncbi:MAG TPA: YhjD/YihY/BrkB family envelope integrity protein [Pseudonocardiaceae bacterium]|jgi:membrane protein|nr:YhjD/YihY/BrkB family envelope integrity protein [Pseudonocardiaceae bacterium]
MLNRLLDRYQRELARRPAIRRVDVSYRHYYELGMHRTASAATYYAVLTLFPFLSLLYLLLAQWVQADPAFLRRSRQVVQNSLGLSSSVVAKLLNAEGSASLHAFLALLGVVGLAYAGLVWMDTVRHGLRLVWVKETERVLWWRRYLRQWATLVATLPSLALVLGLAVFTSRSPYRLLSDSGLRIPLLWRYPIEGGALAFTVFWASLVCYVAYRWLGKAQPTKNVKLAALVSGTCLGVLAAVAAFLLPITLSNPYGIVVAILAMMLWVSGAIRVTLAMAVWAASGTDRPASDPVAS